jgi:Ca-activated chloride channel homolog
MSWKRMIVAAVAAMFFCCGGFGQQSRQTREVQEKIRVETDVVVLSVTVKDSNDKLVSGLEKEDFHVFDDGVEQQILSFTDESLPLSLLILVDSDMKWKEGTAMAGSLRSLIGDIADSDEAMVCRYDMLFHEGEEFTGDSRILMAALKDAQSAAQPSPPYIPQPLITDSISTTGPPSAAAPTYAGSRPSKAIDDALYSAGQLLQKRPKDRRRLILLISDGVNEPKLNRRAHEDVLGLLLQNNISVYTMAVGSDKSKHKFGDLEDYSAKTGGGIFYGTTTFMMQTLYSRMTEQARHDYTLVYAPVGNDKAASFHRLRVAAGSGYSVSTRSGYYSVGADAPNP